MCILQFVKSSEQQMIQLETVAIQSGFKYIRNTLIRPLTGAIMLTVSKGDSSCGSVRCFMIRSPARVMSSVTNLLEGCP